MVSEIQRKKNQVKGVCYVVLTAFCWTLSSWITNTIFTGDATFDKPFFLTYVMTSVFILYFPKHLGLLFPKRDHCFGLQTSTSPTQLTFVQTIRIAAMFCPIWFSMNYTFNLSLSKTTVGSNTVLSSLSGPFCVFWSYLFLSQKPSMPHILGVLFTLGGAFIIGSQDKSSAESTFVGDILAITSACIYGFYTTMMKYSIGDDSRLDMTLFFMLIGIINMFIFLPFFFMLHFFNLETFQLPPKDIAIALLINGLVNLLSDYFWARSILLSSPIVATIGLTLTIPMALVVDWFEGEQHRPPYILGCFIIVCGFFLVNVNLVDGSTYDQLNEENSEATSHEIELRERTSEISPMTRDDSTNVFVVRPQEI